MAQPAGLALDGGDPRASMSGPGIADYPRHTRGNLHDPNVTIEEYFHWAKATRQEEKDVPRVHHPIRKLIGVDKGKKDNSTGQNVSSTVNVGEKHHNNAATVSSSSDKATKDKHEEDAGATSDPQHVAVVTEDEWFQASRAARTATWGAVFYLITTDVLGPYSVP